MIRVMVVDDHELVRVGLRYVLEEAGMEMIGEAESAAEAIRRIPALRPDVCLLDYRLRDGTGAQVCREVRAVDPSLKCLFLTSFEDDEALTTIVQAGACGYVLKQANTAALVEGIRRVAAGERVFAPGAEERARRHAVGVAGAPAWGALSGHEERIIALVAQGLTNRQIAGRLFLAEPTIRHQIARILVKLGVHGRTQAAVLFSQAHPVSTNGRSGFTRSRSSGRPSA